MAQVTITFLPEGITAQVEVGTTILDAARAAGLVPNAPCGGRGTCGKCRVKLLSKEDAPEVLACQTAAEEDLTVQFFAAREEGGVISSRSENIGGTFLLDGKGKCIAFDIGTTTVVGYLLEPEGTVVASAGSLNPQMSYGADVISRINYSLDHGRQELTAAIRGRIRELIQKLCRDNGVAEEEIVAIAVVGNTCMHHLFMDIDTRPLVTPPYSPAETRAMTVPAKELLGLCENATVRMFPNIAGFVGGDTVGCMTALSFDGIREPALMIDIGTNGELVMTDGQRMLTCSTAAGPAFEGAKISCGMRAADGAIDHVWLEEGQVRCSVLGDCEPVGVCGSALLDAVAVYLELGDIGMSGRVDTEDKLLHLAGQVALTQNDVNELQLAKGAIAAGIEMMARELGLEIGQIQKVYLAGAFGNYMNPDSACAIGLIPKELRERIIPVGNAAGGGAQLAAISEAAYRYATSLAENSDFLDLAAQPDFQDTYVDHLIFEEDEDE